MEGVLRVLFVTCEGVVRVLIVMCEGVVSVLIVTCEGVVRVLIVTCEGVVNVLIVTCEGVVNVLIVTCEGVVNVLIVLFDCVKSGQVNAAAGTSAGDPAQRLNSIGTTGGRGLQSTPGVSRLTPGDSVPTAHDHAIRTHAEGPTDVHVNSRLTAEHAAANCTSDFTVVVVVVQLRR